MTNPALVSAFEEKELALQRLTSLAATNVANMPPIERIKLDIQTREASAAWHRAVARYETLLSAWNASSPSRQPEGR